MFSAKVVCCSKYYQGELFLSVKELHAGVHKHKYPHCFVTSHSPAVTFFIKVMSLKFFSRDIFISVLIRELHCGIHATLHSDLIMFSVKIILWSKFCQWEFSSQYSSRICMVESIDMNTHAILPHCIQLNQIFNRNLQRGIFI